jgi:hypothetical protein
MHVATVTAVTRRAPPGVRGRHDRRVQQALVTLDMAGDDEATICVRLDHAIPALMTSAVRCVVLDLGERRALRRSTAEAIALAHRELRAVRGRLVVATSREAVGTCERLCPELAVAATVRQAHAVLGST